LAIASPAAAQTSSVLDWDLEALPDTIAVIDRGG
jgi:hypothetical protein